MYIFWIKKTYAHSFVIIISKTQQHQTKETETKGNRVQFISFVTKYIRSYYQIICFKIEIAFCRKTESKGERESLHGFWIRN